MALAWWHAPSLSTTTAALQVLSLKPNQCKSGRRTGRGLAAAAAAARAVSELEHGDGDDGDALNSEVAKAERAEATSTYKYSSGVHAENAVPHGNEETERSNPENKIREVKIYTRDGVITRKYTTVDPNVAKVRTYEKKRISQTDFAGLEFSEKKSKRHIPVGLKPGLEFASSGILPEVQLIVGDATKLGAKPSVENPASSGLYKPKVATWGVFPRPENISKTYGGGRTIRPGDALETDEERIAREAETKRLLENFKRRMGLIVDPKVKEECEQALTKGNKLMEAGRLIEAIPYFKKIMEEMVYQTELHGVAALQLSICLDSLRRSDEAQVLYKKLSLHPDVSVQRRAKNFMFGFQAMEILKVSASYAPKMKTENYFELMPNDYENTYRSTQEDQMKGDLLIQTLFYMLFLLSPLLAVLLLATRRI